MSKEIIQSVRKMLDNDVVKEQFKNALKEHAQAFQAGIIELVSNDKYLASCDPKSIISGALTLATLKLPLNKSLGFAYLVPFKGVAQPQIGYKGLIQLAQRTGDYKCINADVVYDGELVSVNKLTGEIDLSGVKVSDTVIGYFAHFSTTYGFSKTFYWSKEKVEKHAGRFSQSFKSGKNTPWQTDFDEMAKKTVLKHLISHYGPMTIETGNTLAKIEESDSVEQNFEIELQAERENPLAVISNEKEVKTLDEITKNSSVDLGDFE